MTNNDSTCRRTCDFCSSAVAILYCRADSAKLCLRCDREVHSTNQLFGKHTRSLLCDACDSSPSSILRSSLSLCHNCDFQDSSHVAHQRRPLEGFTGCLSVDEIVEWLGLEGVEKKESAGDDVDFEGSEDFLVWETPTIVSIDDLIASNGSQRSFRAIGVPPLPKNRKAACGKYKEEILSQLREMAKSESISDDVHENINSIKQFQFSTPQQDLYPENMHSGSGNNAYLTSPPSFEGGSFWCTDKVDLANENLSSKLIGSSFEDSCLVPDKDSKIGGNCNTSLVNYGHEEQPIDCIKTESPQVLPKYPRELTSQERETAISRYKEKKRTRRFDKHVRYESRRIRAETRTRIKGRFAKIQHQSSGTQ